MSLGCARCGDCCNPVKIDFGAWTRAVAEARRYGPGELDLSDPEYRQRWADCVFLASALRPICSAGDVIYLACAHYDREHEACRAYAGRPPLCRDFPWYGRQPDGEFAELRCSYLLDVPPAARAEGSRPLIPLTAITRSDGTSAA